MGPGGKKLYDREPWSPPIVELAGGGVGHLLCWEQHERDGSWHAWVSWVQSTGHPPAISTAPLASAPTRYGDQKPPTRTSPYRGACWAVTEGSGPGHRLVQSRTG